MKNLNNNISKRKYSLYVSWIILTVILGFLAVKLFNDSYYLRLPWASKTERVISPVKASPKATQKPTSLLPIAEASTDKLLREDPNRSDSWYKLFIYQHESGVDPKKYNSSGCVGLGQACPGSKLLVECPNLDYTCEDSFFENYMTNRYGSWENAYTFWINNNWW